MLSFKNYTEKEKKTVSEPSPIEYRKIHKPHEFLPVDSIDELLSNPPSDNSNETRVELLELQDRSEMMKDRIGIMERWDEDIAGNFIKYMVDHNLPYDKNEIYLLEEQAETIVMQQKYLFKRPRPFSVARSLGINLNSIISETTQNPSYPSGHSTLSRIVALYLSERHRSHSDAFLNMAEECGESRLNAAIHYPSDHEAGVMLANHLWGLCCLRQEKTS